MIDMRKYRHDVGYTNAEITLLKGIRDAKGQPYWSPVIAKKLKHAKATATGLCIFRASLHAKRHPCSWSETMRQQIIETLSRLYVKHEAAA